MAVVSPNRRPPPLLLDDACALFLDVDGTLLEFAAHPAGVLLDAALRDVLAQLHQRLHGALALVSGRPIAQLDFLFAPLRLPAAGLHGHQLRHVLGGSSPNALPAADLWKMRQEADRLGAANPGLLVEDKGPGLALHWRAAPWTGNAAVAFAQDWIPRLPGYRLQPGDHVIEFVPDGSDKGSAIVALLAQPPFRGRLPVFVGDDLTDEYGFAAVHRLGGWGVLVGDRAVSDARYALPDIAAVHAWLRRNAGQCETPA